MSFSKMTFRALTMVLLLQTVLSDPISRKKEREELEKLQQQCEDVVHLNDNYFLLDETRNVSDIPTDLHVHWKSGDLYFTIIGGRATFSEFVINKQTGLQTKLNISGTQNTAIDNTNNVVYIATDHGVYRQKEDGSAELYAASGEDVICLTVTKDGSALYMSTYPKYQVYKITQDGKYLEIVSAIPYGNSLTVDPKGNLFFTDDKETAYVLQAGQSVPEKIKGVPGEKLVFYSVNDDEEVFAMDQDSKWYYVDGQTASATYWGSFGLPAYTFAFDDADNVYIGVEGAIKKFKHYDEDPCDKV